MVFKVSALRSISGMGTIKRSKRTSRLASRTRRSKTSKRATRTTKLRSTRKMKSTLKMKYTRANVKSILSRKTRFATRKTKVFKPISASDWQVEHQTFGIGPLKKGELSRFGYSSAKPAGQRDKSLDKAVSEYGSTSVFRKLNALYVYNRNRSPKMSTLFKKDRDYVKKTYM